RTDLVVGRTEVEIEADGRPAWRQAVDHPLGGATRPLSAEACRQKFMAAAEGAVSRPDPARLERLVAQTERLESLDDVSGLPRLLA
ncbi:MAG: hypothetical protein HYS36_00535, partial [Candidatus Rokubacteria bacterium]|nr:hypothetical protein [Candidatus Rokubacteria bacterium]